VRGVTDQRIEIPDLPTLRPTGFLGLIHDVEHPPPIPAIFLDPDDPQHDAGLAADVSKTAPAKRD
jgi:hypothetical protein